MEKINLLIKDYEDKKAQNSGKRYTRFDTNQGWFSAFEENVIEPIKKLEGKWVKVGVKIDDNYKNIREFHGEAKGPSEEKVEETQAKQSENSEPIKKVATSFNDERQVSIIAQTLTKCVSEVMKTSDASDEKAWVKARRDVLKSYNDFYTMLKNSE